LPPGRDSLALCFSVAAMASPVRAVCDVDGARRRYPISSAGPPMSDRKRFS
jgi:hypothetical protein